MQPALRGYTRNGRQKVDDVMLTEAAIIVRPDIEYNKQNYSRNEQKG